MASFVVDTTKINTTARRIFKRETKLTHDKNSIMVNEVANQIRIRLCKPNRFSDIFVHQWYN